MLGAQQRIHRSADFALAVRRGIRASRGPLTVHVISMVTAGGTTPQQPRCGFVVSKAVGNSVVRHATTRRLRHLCHDHYGQFPAGALIVVRAKPSITETCFADLDRYFAYIVEKLFNDRGPKHV